MTYVPVIFCVRVLRLDKLPNSKRQHFSVVHGIRYICTLFDVHILKGGKKIALSFIVQGRFSSLRFKSGGSCLRIFISSYKNAFDPLGKLLEIGLETYWKLLENDRIDS